MLKNKRVLVIGLGISGQAAARFLMQRGLHVLAVDSKLNLASTNPKIADLVSQGLEVIHESDPIDFSKISLVVVSPGVPQTHKLYLKAAELSIPIIGEVELACRELALKPYHKCLAITGTNGKTTVTSLIEHVLQKQAIKALALGNIGTPMTDVLDLKSDLSVFVLELSSFQLETLKSSFIDAGVILNITPDHLDRYPTMQEYASAKVKMKDLLKPAGVLFVEDLCFNQFKELFSNQKVLTYGYEKHCYAYTDTKDVFVDGNKIFTLPLNLQGKKSHDVENLIAAYLLCKEMGVHADAFLNAYETFKKPSHRIEFIRTLNGVTYYDDSKGTNIDAVIRAVDFLNEEIILIAGGVDKGAPYTPWLKAFDGKVKGICAIGLAAPKIASDLNHKIPVVLCESLEEAVGKAKDLSQKLPSGNSAILLSPGCSSFDMFKDYAHRGLEFQRLVNAL